jgi:RES domain-containing protein
VSSVVVWRLCAAKYGLTAFSGEGARLYGGRWSPPGIALVYAAESRALAVVEILANVDDAETLFDVAWVFVSADVPADLIEKPARMPESWRHFPHSTDTQTFGLKWAQAGSSAVLCVPSAVVPGEFNYLLSPAHPAFERVKIGPPQSFSFDPRLVG